MQDAFGVDRDAVSKARVRLKHQRVIWGRERKAQRAQAYGAGLNHRLRAAAGRPVPPPAPVVPWHAKTSNRVLMGLTGAAVIGGTAIGATRAKKQQAATQPVTKSFVSIGGKIVTKTPKQMKALGLRPAKHSAMHGVTAEDEHARKLAESAWTALRPMATKKSVIATTKVRGRKVYVDDLEGAPGGVGGIQVALPRPGKGQRQAKHLVGIDRDAPNSENLLRHELMHANTRKPLSAAMRKLRNNKKLWADEARSDAAMTVPSKSGYADVASGRANFPLHIGNEPTHMRRYLAISHKTESARGNTNLRPITLKSTKAKASKVVSDDREQRRTFALPGPRKPFRVNTQGEITKAAHSHTRKILKEIASQGVTSGYSRAKRRKR